jgi:hypothetical protein
MVPIALNEPDGHSTAVVHLPLDWDHVARAFRAANQAVGWGADITLTPERRHALVCFPRERAGHVENTIAIFNRVVERHVGLEAFRSLGIELEPRSTSHDPPYSADAWRTR